MAGGTQAGLLIHWFLCCAQLSMSGPRALWHQIWRKKTIKINENPWKASPASQPANQPNSCFFPTTLAVLGILSSCPRVMMMQCWKSQIPPPLSTRPQAIIIIIIGFLVVCWPKKKKYDSAKFPSNIKTQRQVKSQHCTCSPKSPKFQEYQNNYPKITKSQQSRWKYMKNTKSTKNDKNNI